MERETQLPVRREVILDAIEEYCEYYKGRGLTHNDIIQDVRSNIPEICNGRLYKAVMDQIGVLHRIGWLWMDTETRLFYRGEKIA